MNNQVILDLIKILTAGKEDRDGTDSNLIDNYLIGKKVIVRTFSAGNWFGLLAEKHNKEVILKNARRMWRWRAMKGISLSEISIYGIDKNNSRICEAVPIQWLESIEITPCSAVATESLESAKNAKPR